MNRINSKYTCLSYVIAVIYLLEQILIYFNVRTEPFPIAYIELIELVAVLHFIEGILAYIFGAKRTEAVVTYRKDEIAGGYQAYGRWIVPLLLFSVQGIYVPIVAGIVYFNESFTLPAKDKAEKMGLFIAIYGIGLLIIRYLFALGYLTLAYTIIIMVIMHETVFVIDRLYEYGDNLYNYPEKGIRLMCFAAVKEMPSPFEQGDIILKINRKPINSEEDYIKIINETNKALILHVKKVSGKQLLIRSSTQELKKLEAVFLPPL